MVELDGPLLSPVTVCGAESLLVQITESPFFIVIEFLENEKFSIFMLCVECTELEVGVGVGNVAVGLTVVFCVFGVGVTFSTGAFTLPA